MKPCVGEKAPKMERLGPEWERPLAEFFHALNEAGNSRHFHPHPMTAEAARSCCNYKGLDFYCVLASGPRVLAYGILRGWDDGYEVPSLGVAVHPGVRRRGLGKAMMLHLHEAARTRGATRIRLKTYPENVSALRLYRCLGYRFHNHDARQLVGYLDLQRR